MIAMRSIAQEYWFIRHQRCECGSPYDRRMATQGLGERDSRPVDIFVILCGSCGRKREFVFDIAAFFGRPNILSFKDLCKDEKALWQMYIWHDLPMESTLNYFTELAESGDTLALDYLEDALRHFRSRRQRPEGEERSKTP